ncbi:hypothetical protein GGI07_001635 [Coemansia sp. Benny D115]|nr:hypothetical protein GGI07_001635 [Coemansia sp. Benny D115]
MPEVADLLSPIEYQVYDSDLDNSASTIPLASQDGVAAATSANSGTNARVLTPQPEAVPGADTKAQPLHSSQQAPDFERGQQVSVAHPQSFVPVPRKQMSMAQLEARIKSRNSMLVAGTLLPAVSMSSCDDLSNRFGPQKDESALLAEKRLRRASRYIHDAPVGAIDFGSDHMWAQLSTSSGNGEEKHIGQGFARRTNRVSQVVADQNKIYSIYGESVWHSTYTTNTNMAARQQAPFGFTSDPKTNDFTDRPGTAVSSRRGARMQTLRSVASSPMLTPWRRMWSKKTQIVPPMPLTQHPNKECWDCASSFTSSVYSGSDCSISLAAVHQSTSQSKAPTRKPSAIRLLVRKAGLSLLRRSVSFYKSVSGSGTVVQEEGFEGAVGAEFEPEMGNSISVRPKRSFRFAEIVRQAGNRLKGSLKHSEALPVTVDDDSDVISAYPSDSLPDRNLDSYLSRSTYHSPSMTTPANSATVCNDDERNDGEHGDADDEDDRSDFSNSTSNDPRSSKYMLPRRPPFLGLHRKAVTAKTNDTRSTGGPKEEDEEEEECQHSLSGQSEETITSLPSHQATNLTSNTNTVSVPTPPAPAAVHYAPVAALASSNGPRLRPTQFSSPFTTLPYGAYAHLNQLRGQSQNQHGHL